MNHEDKHSYLKRNGWKMYEGYWISPSTSDSNYYETADAYFKQKSLESNLNVKKNSMFYCFSVSSRAGI